MKNHNLRNFNALRKNLSCLFVITSAIIEAYLRLKTS